MSGPTKRARTQAEQPAIHTPLTLDDRDALDLLKRSIRWQAVLVQHVLSTWDKDNDFMEDRDRETLEVGLIELCASIVRDSDALTELVDVAEKRRTDGAR